MPKSKKVYYWSPFISSVATIQAVVRSAESLVKYSDKKYEPYIINVAGEWNSIRSLLKEKKISIIDLTRSNIIDQKNWTGFLKSRIIYWYIFLRSFIPLYFLLRKNSPDYFIAQLITSLPLVLNYIFSFRFKFILRISGLPKLNYLRKFLWKITLKKIFVVTCPTAGTVNYLKEFNIRIDKIKLLYDPIISSQEIMDKKREKNDISNLFPKSYFISIGRLTKQKNFLFLLSCFNNLVKTKYKDLKLVLIGEGELKIQLENFIKKNNLEKNVYLLGFKKNIFKYLKDSRGLISSSLWEDPGFVLIEAAYLNIPIISSNCKNGPEEILDYGNNGVIFESNNSNSFVQQFNKFMNLHPTEINKFKIKAKKSIKKFSVFNHYKDLIYILK